MMQMTVNNVSSHKSYSMENVLLIALLVSTLLMDHAIHVLKDVKNVLTKTPVSNVTDMTALISIYT